MNYSRLIKNVIGNGARSNKFVVRFNDLGNYARDLNFICTSSKIPSVQTITTDYKYKGHSITVPIGTRYNTDWSADFFVDEEHRIKTFFEEWIEMFDARGKNISMLGKDFKFVDIPNSGTMSDFTCTVDVEQYDFDTELLRENQTPKIIYRLYNVFPTAVQDISLDENDSLEKINVSFKYSYFERIKG